MEPMTEVRSESALYQQHQRELMRFATTLVGPSDAPDVVSDAMESLLRRGTLAQADNPRALMHRAVLRQSQSLHRSTFRRNRRERRFRSEMMIENPELRPDVVDAVLAALVVTKGLDSLGQRGDVGGQEIVSTTLSGAGDGTPTTTLVPSAAESRLLAAMDIVTADATSISQRLQQASFSGPEPAFDTAPLGVAKPFAPIPSEDTDSVTDALWMTDSTSDSESLLTWTPVYIGYLDGQHVAVRVIRERASGGEATEYLCTRVFDRDQASEACFEFEADTGLGEKLLSLRARGLPSDDEQSFMLFLDLSPDVAVVTMGTSVGNEEWQRPVGGVVMFNTGVLDGSAALFRFLDADGQEIATQTSPTDPG